MRRAFIHFVAALGILGLVTSSVNAAIVNLTITFTPAANSASGTWRAFAQASTGDNAGLADFALDVTGTNGVTISTSSQNSPRVADDGNGNVAGFGSFRTGGTLGIGIGAAQDVIGYADAADIIQGVGHSAFTADFSGTGGGSTAIAFPVLLASGIYANNGAGGTLNVNVHVGGFIDVLNGTGAGTWVGPANVSAATVNGGSVNVPPTIPVPEPASLALIGLGAFGAFGRRRRA